MSLASPRPSLELAWLEKALACGRPPTLVGEEGLDERIFLRQAQQQTINFWAAHALRLRPVVAPLPIDHPPDGAPGPFASLDLKSLAVVTVCLYDCKTNSTDCPDPRPPEPLLALVREVQSAPALYPGRTFPDCAPRPGFGLASGPGLRRCGPTASFRDLFPTKTSFLIAILPVTVA